MSNLLFRAATDASDTSFTTNSITGVVPTGTAAGDAQFAIVTGGSIAPAAAPTFTTPSGWVLLGSSSQFPLAGGLINLREWVFTRKAGASEVNQAFTASANCAMGIIRASYQNPDPNGFAGQVVFGNSSSGTTVAVGPLTTTRLNSLLLAFITQGTAQSITPASGFTERLDNPASGISIADAIQAAIGSSGTKNFTIPTSGDAAWAFIEGYSNNTVTNVETITFSDSQTGVAKFVGSVGESISLSDSQVAGAHFLGASLETIAFSDAVSGVFRQLGDQAESISLIDSQDAVLVSGSIAIESISFADSVDGLFHGVGSVDDTLLFSDSVAGAFRGIDSIGESITFADDQSGVFQATGALTESISLSESVSAAGLFVGLVDEAIAFADVVEGVEPGDVQVVEQITLADDQVATIAALGQVVESLSFVDAVNTTVNVEPVEEVIPTYIVGKKLKAKERKLMGGPRWERHELEDLRSLVQARPFEQAQREAEKQAQEAIAKAANKQEVESLASMASAMEVLAQNEALEAQALEAAILAEQQALEDAQIMAIIAELL